MTEVMPPSDWVLRGSCEDNLRGNFQLYLNNACIFSTAGIARDLSKTKRLRLNRSPPHPIEDERLFERGLNAGEGRVQLRAEALHDRDDRNRDASSDQAILDGGRAGFVLNKLSKILHVWLHRSALGCLSEAAGPLSRADPQPWRDPSAAALR